MEENQFVFYATFKPKEGKDKELLEITKESGQFLKNQDGLIGYLLLEPQNEGEPLVFISNWKTKEHFDRAMSSEEGKKNHRGESMKNAQAVMEEAVAKNYILSEMYHSN